MKHVTGPMGVRGRNSDNGLCRRVLGWEPPTDLVTGLTPTYEWIAEQVLLSREWAGRRPRDRYVAARRGSLASQGLR